MLNVLYFCYSKCTSMAFKNKCIRVFADQVQISTCRKKIAENEASFTALSNVLALAGNGVRLKILYLLSEETELCPCDLADIFEMTVPAISQHLRKLKDAKIVKTRKEGQTIFYALKGDHLPIIEPLFQYIDNAKGVLA